MNCYADTDGIFYVRASVSRVRKLSPIYIHFEHIGFRNLRRLKHYRYKQMCIKNHFVLFDLIVSYLFICLDRRTPSQVCRNILLCKSKPYAHHENITNISIKHTL